MDPRPTEGRTKSWLSVCHSVCLSIHPSVQHFPQEWQISFSDFWHNGKRLEYLKTIRALFPGKFIFAQIWAKKVAMATWPQDKICLDFSKNFIISFSWKKSKMKTNIFIDISTPTSCLAKLWVSSYGPKFCQPIKLQGSLNVQFQGRSEWWTLLLACR